MSVYFLRTNSNKSLGQLVHFSRLLLHITKCPLVGTIHNFTSCTGEHSFSRLHKQQTLTFSLFFYNLIGEPFYALFKNLYSLITGEVKHFFS